MMTQIMGTVRRLDSGKRYGAVALLLVQTLPIMPLPALAADANSNNVHLYGALVAEPCVIPPGDEEISLDFGTIIDKYLYLNTRTHGQAFDIHLTECDLSIGKTVKVTFTGKENTALPGLLAINGDSEATGIAIGLETQEGQVLPLNQNSSSYPLQDGNTTLTMQAYVQGEPKAITEQTINKGPFNAVTTFNLEYE
ncbi:TPA: type 1 fimbrial protein [Serratia marcescens]|nr:type 1 fimbrial protein [Serratia marcescens]